MVLIKLQLAVQGLMTLTLLTLAIIFGLSVAALVGGYRKYMFYRTDNVQGFHLRTWYVSFSRHHSVAQYSFIQPLLLLCLCLPKK